MWGCSVWEGDLNALLQLHSWLYMAIIISSIQAKNHINHIEDDNDHERDDVGWKGKEANDDDDNKDDKDADKIK